MLNLKSMLAALTERSLVLVDEMGTGTAPEEGAALAVALLDEFRARRCLVLATTHHDRLKAYASTTPGVLNASVEFDEVRLAPTYRLRVGVPGGSSGIAIARRLGLPESDCRARQRADHARGARGRRADRLFASQPRRRRADAARPRRADRGASSRNGARCAKNGSSGSGKRIAELEKRFADALAQNERDMAPRARSGQGSRAARAARKADAPPRGPGALGGARRSGCRRRGASLGIAGRSRRGRRDAAASVRSTNSCRARALRVRGFSAPVVLRRRDGASAEVEAGPLRMKVPLARDHRHRRGRAGEGGGGAVAQRAGRRSARVGRAAERHHRARRSGVR